MMSLKKLNFSIDNYYHINSNIPVFNNLTLQQIVISISSQIDKKTTGMIIPVVLII